MTSRPFARTLAAAAAALTLSLAAAPAHATDSSPAPTFNVPATPGVDDAAATARNAAALARWQTYLARLDRAGITPPSAQTLADPAQGLPEGLSPLQRRAQQVPGVATVRVGKRKIRVLPAETITAVSTAFTQVGKPYRPRARGPRGYSCGGYTAAMFRRAGLPLGTAAVTGQYRKRHVVPRTQRQIGDLALVGSPATGFHHVGIFVGGGLMLAADGATGKVSAISATAAHTTIRPSLPAPVSRNTAQPPRHGIACGTTLTAVTAPMDGGLVSPVTPGQFTYSALFGQKGPYWSSGSHTGLDFAADTGTPVYAPAEGVVRVRADQAWWAGRHFVQVDHGNGIVSWYAHLSYAAVQDGQRVTAGQLIGQVGNEGNSTGPHLHLEMRSGARLSPYVNGTPVNPMPYLTGKKVWPAPTPADPVQDWV